MLTVTYVDIQIRIGLLIIKLQNCMRLNIKIKIKLFVGITYKKKKFIIHPEYFDAKNFFSRPFIHNIKHKTNTVQDMSRQIKITL